MQISNLIKIRRVEAEMFYADRRTDMTNPTVAFRNFANSPIHILQLYFLHSNLININAGILTRVPQIAINDC